MKILVPIKQVID